MGTRQAVVITGMGVVSPIGASVAELASALLETRSGIQHIQPPPLKRGCPTAIVPGELGKQFSTLELVCTAASNWPCWPQAMRCAMPGSSAWSASAPGPVSTTAM